MSVIVPWGETRSILNVLAAVAASVMLIRIGHANANDLNIESVCRKSTPTLMPVTRVMPTTFKHMQMAFTIVTFQVHAAALHPCREKPGSKECDHKKQQIVGCHCGANDTILPAPVVALHAQSAGSVDDTNESMSNGRKLAQK